MCDNAPMTPSPATPSPATPSTITITIPRSVARPLGILDRETTANLTSSDAGWLTRNIHTRTNKRQCKALHKALIDAGVTL